MTPPNPRESTDELHRTALLRTGRRVGRTIYAQVGPVPSGDDPLVATADSPLLADRIVTAVNAAHARASAPTDPGQGGDLAALRDLAEAMDSVALGFAAMSDTPQHGPPIAEWARQLRDVVDRLAAPSAPGEAADVAPLTRLRERFLDMNRALSPPKLTVAVVVDEIETEIRRVCAAGAPGEAAETEGGDPCACCGATRGGHAADCVQVQPPEWVIDDDRPGVLRSPRPDDFASSPAPAEPESDTAGGDDVVAWWSPSARRFIVENPGSGWIALSSEGGEFRDRYPEDVIRLAASARPAETGETETCACCLGDPREVCSECGEHACWAGRFMCDASDMAGTRQADLPTLGRGTPMSGAAVPDGAPAVGAVVETVDELDRLPVGTVLSGDRLVAAWKRESGDWADSSGNFNIPTPMLVLASSTFRVLDVPGGSAGGAPLTELTEVAGLLGCTPDQVPARVRGLLDEQRASPRVALDGEGSPYLLDGSTYRLVVGADDDGRPVVAGGRVLPSELGIAPTTDRPEGEQP